MLVTSAAAFADAMRLTIRLLGAEVFHVSTEADPEEDTARDLSGGNLGSEYIEAGETDRFMGFTNGREDS